MDGARERQFFNASKATTTTAALIDQQQQHRTAATTKSRRQAAFNCNNNALPPTTTTSRFDARRMPIDGLFASNIFKPQTQHQQHYAQHTSTTLNPQNYFSTRLDALSLRDEDDVAFECSSYEASKLRNEEALYRSRLKTHQLHAAMNNHQQQLLLQGLPATSKPQITEAVNASKKMQIVNFKSNDKTSKQASGNNNNAVDSTSLNNTNVVVTNDDELEDGDRKKKYFTAKYGQHQMSLIKKRLKIEMWLHDELLTLARKLAASGSASSKSEAETLADDIEIEIDQLLDTSDESTRIQLLQDTLSPLQNLVEATQAKSAQTLIDAFIDTILQQVKLL